MDQKVKSPMRNCPLKSSQWQDRISTVEEDLAATCAAVGPLHHDRAALEMYLGWLKGRCRLAEIEEERQRKAEAKRKAPPVVTVADLTKQPQAEAS